MGSRQRWLAVAAMLLGAGILAAADPSDGLSGPRLISVFPLGLQRGSTFEVEVKGAALDEVYAAWFECDDVRASIKRVEALNREPAKPQSDDKVYEAAGPDPATHRVLLEVIVPPQAELGLHGFRLVTPRGMTNGLVLHVVPDPVVLEAATQTGPSAAQALKPPLVVNGKMEHKGEVDFYSFAAAAGDAFRFDTFSNFQPTVGYRAKVELALYDRSGSWFDPHRMNRIHVRGPALSWEPMHALTRWFDKRIFPTEFVLYPRLSHQFQQPGQYLVSVTSFLGAGAPEHFYMLRIVAADTSAQASQPWFGRPAHRDPGDWLERDSSTLRQWGSFTRPLASTRLQALASRSVAPRGNDASAQCPLEIGERCEAEPNDSARQAGEVTVPCIVSGVLDKAADTDLFSFQATQGQQLAFEIETPRFAPPLFNPWLRLRNAEGQELCANIYKEYGGDGDDVNKNLERKTLYTIPETGTYWLELRDLSLRDGGPDFRYRVLIRPQVPHLGRVEVNLDVVSESSVLVDRTDHINLAQGQSQEIVLVCEMEEGLAGSIVIGAQNLPDGVELMPSTPSARTQSLLTGFQYRPPGRQVMPPDNYRPERSPATVVLVARPDAVPSQLPTMVRLTARPIVNGRAGAALPVESFPLMVIAKNTNNK